MYSDSSNKKKVPICRNRLFRTFMLDASTYSLKPNNNDKIAFV